MPRHMSFALTPQQILNRSKTVTRRTGWWSLLPCAEIYACEKCMGLKGGEKVNKLALIEVLKLSSERLCDITQEDVIAEGFPSMTPAQFVAMFCDASQCTPNHIVNRIEFKYVEQEQLL